MLTAHEPQPRVRPPRTSARVLRGTFTSVSTRRHPLAETLDTDEDVR